MIRSNGAVYAHLSPTAFSAAVPHLGDLAVVAWLRGHHDADLPEPVLSALLDRRDCDVDQELARLAVLPDDVLDRLVATTRVPVARVVAGRSDLCAGQLERLLSRDDAAVSSAVWRHAACTDDLRRRILTGRTMNPRARDADKLAPTPAVADVPARLLADARASACPRVLGAGWPGRRSDAELQRMLVAVGRAVQAHLAGRSPYKARDLQFAFDTVAGRVAREAVDADLRSAARDAVTATRRWGGFERAIDGALEAIAGLTVADTAVPDDAEVPGGLRTALLGGTACAADLVGVNSLGELTPDQLHPSSLTLLLGSKPELLDLDWLGDRISRGGLPERMALGAATVERLADAGYRVPAQACRSVLGQLQVSTLTAALHPARQVLAVGDHRSGTSSQLGSVLTRALGGHLDRWETFATLVDGFDGTVAELLDTVLALVGGDAAAA